MIVWYGYTVLEQLSYTVCSISIKIRLNWNCFDCVLTIDISAKNLPLYENKYCIPVFIEKILEFSAIYVHFSLFWHSVYEEWSSNIQKPQFQKNIIYYKSI
jgi:hypothetical protein